MTVKELMNLLKDQPDDADVLYRDTSDIDQYELPVGIIIDAISCKEIHGVSKGRSDLNNGVVYLWSV